MNSMEYFSMNFNIKLQFLNVLFSIVCIFGLFRSKSFVVVMLPVLCLYNIYENIAFALRILSFGGYQNFTDFADDYFILIILSIIPFAVFIYSLLSKGFRKHFIIQE